MASGSSGTQLISAPHTAHETRQSSRQTVPSPVDTADVRAVAGFERSFRPRPATLRIGTNCCWMSHCRGSPSLVTLVQVCAYLDPIVGSAHAYLTKCQRPESTEREHMSGQEARAPQSLLDLEDTRVRYDTYQELEGAGYCVCIPIRISQKPKCKRRERGDGDGKPRTDEHGRTP